MMKKLMENVPAYRDAMNTVSENDHIFVKGLREYYAATQPEKSLYPDANSTMRMSYGSVQDYQPADAVHYDYVCTANGILQKYVPGDYEFDAPKASSTSSKRKTSAFTLTTTANSSFASFLPTTSRAATQAARS